MATTVKPRKPPIIEDEWEDVEDEWEDVLPIAMDEEEPEEELSDESMLSKTWDKISKPMWEGPSRLAKQVGDYIDQPSLASSDGSYLGGVKARAKGMAAGMMQGVGDLASGLTSPIDLATTALTMGSGYAAKRGLTTIADLTRKAAKTGGALVAGHGGQQILDPNTTWQEKLYGAVELAGGGTAMHPSSYVTGKPTPEVKVAPPNTIEPTPAKVDTKPPTAPVSGFKKSQSSTAYQNARAETANAARFRDQVIPPTLEGASVENARINPQTGETIIPGVTNRLPSIPEAILPEPTPGFVEQVQPELAAPVDTPIQFDKEKYGLIPPPTPERNAAIAAAREQAAQNRISERIPDNVDPVTGELFDDPNSNAAWGLADDATPDYFGRESSDGQNLAPQETLEIPDEIRPEDLNLARNAMEEIKNSYGPDSEEFMAAARELEDLTRVDNAKSVGSGTGIRPLLNEASLPDIDVPELTGIANDMPELDPDMIDYNARNDVQTKAAEIANTPEQTGNMSRKALAKIAQNARLNVDPAVVADIQANGITRPVILRQKRSGNNTEAFDIYSDTHGKTGEFEVSEGGDILAAAKALGIDDIPVKIVGNIPDNIAPETLGPYNQMYDKTTGARKFANDAVPPENGPEFFNQVRTDRSAERPRGPISSDNWAAQVAELDARGAPDTAYRDILSTGGKNALKKGETWRGKVEEYIQMDRDNNETRIHEEAEANETQGFTNTELGPETTPPPTGMVNEVAPKSNLHSAAMGQTMTVRGKNATPELVKKIQAAGFEYQGTTENGGFKFKKTSEGKEQPILESELGHKAQPTPPVDNKIGLPRKIYDLSRGLMSVDPPFITSAAFRQAAPLIGTKYWFKGWGEAAKAYGSEALYTARMDQIKNNALHRPRMVGGKLTKSFADEIGIRMTDLKDASSNRLEGIRSNIAEAIPLYGRHVKASNRAFSAFLNTIRDGQLQAFVKDGKALAEAHSDPMMDITQNIPLAKEFAGFINDATGASTLETGIGKHQYNLEEHAAKLADAFFSPRLMASRIRMLNPSTYVMANPRVRKQYVHGMLRTVGAWWGIAQLGQLAGQTVITDPNNPDFGKIKIGNTRLDPGAGFQQFLVLGSRIKPDWAHLSEDYKTDSGFMPLDLATGLLTTPGGGMSSSISGEHREFGGGFNPKTRASTALDFTANKLHPTAKLIYDIMNATERNPVYIGDRIAQMYVPMMVGDLTELAQENPELIPLIIPFTGAGGGSQTYSGEPSKPSLTPMLPWDLGRFDYGIGSKEQF